MSHSAARPPRVVVSTRQPEGFRDLLRTAVANWLGHHQRMLDAGFSVGHL